MINIPLQNTLKRHQYRNTICVEENDTIYGFIVVDQQQSEWYDELEWPIDREGALCHS